ncbi:MAG: hypothetical protein V2A58_07230, partial [Planctomycetota bacterium]
GEAMIVHTQKGASELEAMRHLPAGEHKVAVKCEGNSRLSSLVVRSIPELLHAGVGYEPSPLMGGGYGPYDWAFLGRIGMLDNTNVILERAPKPENAAGVEEWLRAGKRRLAYYNVYWIVPKGQVVTADIAFAKWTGSAGFQSDGYGGIVVDEFSGGYPAGEEATAMIEAVSRIGGDRRFAGRVFYPYCSGMYTGKTGKVFLTAVLAHGYKFAEERYLAEQRTEAEARKYLGRELRQHMYRYNSTFGDCAKDMIVNLGYMSAPPETLNVNPCTDFKVFMDMQMNMIANDPVFFGLYGVAWYHVAYADEEIIRWTAKLYRHYCVEGKRERLSSDPYELDYVENPDFESGTEGWTLAPAEMGSIRADRAPGYAWLQGRYPWTTEGDTFLVTCRSAKAPNRFRQEIRNLTPGRLYSMKMFVTDRKDLVEKESRAREHPVSVKISGVEIIDRDFFKQVYGSGLAGHGYGGFGREKQLYITYSLVVFRASAERAELSVSDWASDDAPGGPIGQELAFNFFEVQPYLEK